MAGSTVYFGSDHAGLSLKNSLLSALRSEFPELVLEDLGTFDTTSTDYPGYAQKVGEAVSANHARGVLVCGSGIGMSIAANKIQGIRAANVWDATSARLSRQHNDSNIVCLGERLTGPEVALEAVRVWLKTDFLQGRHSRRVGLISQLEK